MSEEIDNITVNYEEDGVLVVKELDREVLSKGAWATIVFRYQEYDRQAGTYGPDKFTIRRYQKERPVPGQVKIQHFQSRAQAEKVIETLGKWLAKE